MAGAKSYDEKLKDKTEKKSLVADIMDKQKVQVQEPMTNQKTVGTFIEIKPKREARASYYFTEETKTKLKEKCKLLGVSENEVINQLVEKFVAE